MADNPFDKSLGSVCVIGGCGFLGHHIVELVLERHSESKVSIIDLRDSPKRSQNRTTFFACDITNEDAVKDAFKKCKPDVVIHTASPLATAAGMKEEVMFKVNVTGTKVLLQAAQEAGVKAFVYTSSASVITGRSNEIINADESWPVIVGKDQPEYYTNTKGLAEASVLAANRSPNKSFLTCAIRPAGIFGEGDAQAIPGLLQASRKGQSRFQVGPNDNLFDWSYVGNIAHAHLLAAVGLLATSQLSIEPLDTEKIDGEAFFITNDSPAYFWDFARRVWLEGGDTVGVDPAKVWTLGTDFALAIATIAEFVLGIFGKTPSLTRLKVRFSVMTRYYSIAKAKQRLGYAPIVSLEEGIRRGVGDYMKKEALDKAEASSKKVQ